MFVFADGLCRYAVQGSNIALAEILINSGAEVDSTAEGMMKFQFSLKLSQMQQRLYIML
jgi:hypothetical protein